RRRHTRWPRDWSSDVCSSDLNRQRIEVVLPVYNEERILRPNVELLVDYLREEFPFRFAILVADNASTDATPAVAAQLAAEFDERSEERRVGKECRSRRGRGTQ